MTEHPVIWLQPICQRCKNQDRLWCQDNVWEDGCECGLMPVKYVLAPDQHNKPEPETEPEEDD